MRHIHDRIWKHFTYHYKKVFAVSISMTTQKSEERLLPRLQSELSLQSKRKRVCLREKTILGLSQTVFKITVTSVPYLTAEMLPKATTIV